MKIDNKISNFIPLSRAIRENWLWEESRPRTQLEAWLWMIMEARFDNTTTKKLIGGKLLTWTRGQFPGSIRFLAEAFKWSKTKVERFLKKLVENDMIAIEIQQGLKYVSFTSITGAFPKHKHLIKLSI